MTDQEKQGQDQLWGDGSGAGMHPTLALISDSLRQDLPLAKLTLLPRQPTRARLAVVAYLAPKMGRS